MPSQSRRFDLSVPQLDMLINGSPVSATALGDLFELVVDDSVELPSMFAFAVAISDAEQLVSSWVDNDLFAIGNTVEIKMGWDNALTSLIVGEITALEPEFVTDRLPLLRVRGFDRGHRLQRGRKTRTFVQKKDSEIATQIGSEAGFSVDATDSGMSLSYVVQASGTDWQFLSHRARRINYEVFVNDRTLFFRPTRNDQSASLTLDFRNDLIEFFPKLSSTAQATEVKVQGWSVKDKEAILEDSTASDAVSLMDGQSSGAAIAGKAFGDAVAVVSDSPIDSSDEAGRIAKAILNEKLLEFIVAEGRCSGQPDLRAGKVIKIDGLGRRFSGLYYVKSATHHMSAGGSYVTDFRVQRNAS
jgi:phage protein D